MSFVFGPKWFFGLDSGFEVIVAVITLLTAIYSLKVFFITKYRKYLYMTLAFIFISASYLLRAAGDYIVFSRITGRLPNVTAAISTVMTVPTFYSLGIILHIFLMFSGFMILVALFLRIHNIRALSLLLALSFILAIFSRDAFVTYHVTLLIMLFYIVIHTINNYSKRRNFKSLLVAFSMSSLFAAQVFFLMLSLSPMYYVIGHCVQMFGWLMLLFNLILVNLE